jgi:hypothetical protein
MAGRFEIPLAHPGHVALLHVSRSLDGGWDVKADVDGVEFAREHCSTWQRVERLRARLQRQLAIDSHAETGTHRHQPRWLVRLIRSAAVVGVGVAILGAAPQPVAEPNIVFQAQVADYLGLRNRLRQGVAPEHIIDPQIREISGALLAARIREARATAKPLDVIPAALAEAIRDRLHRGLEPVEVDVLLMDLYPAGLPVHGAQVNASYADTAAVCPPVAVLSALPPLPGILGYRLVGRDLVIWDEEAQLVIDVISAALPEPRIWKFLDVSSFTLRECVREGLSAGRLDVRELLDEMARDALPGAAAPMVGELFDWDVGALMPPSVLKALPALPPPLEYRFVGVDLVVIDVRTGRVEGILPHALPRAHTPHHAPLRT